MRAKPILVVAGVMSFWLVASAQAIVNGQPDGSGHPYVGMVFQTGSEAACSAKVALKVGR